MLQRKILIRKGLGPVDTRRPGAIPIEEVTALAHEIGDDSVELGALVALGPVLVVLVLAGAELAEVLGCPGDHIGKEFEGDAAEGFTL